MDVALNPGGFGDETTQQVKVLQQIEVVLPSQLHGSIAGPAALTKQHIFVRLLKRFLRSNEAATAIEFSILAIPFLMVIFATFETFVAFAGEQMVMNATDTLSRKIRTGEITFNTGRTTDMNETQFRAAFCDEIAIVISCSATEKSTPAKLYIDLHQVASFAGIPKTVPLISTSSTGKDLDTSGFSYAPGGAGTINMMRVYYRWSIVTDLVRPYISNLQPAGTSSPSQFLIVATTAFQNEDYP